MTSPEPQKYSVGDKLEVSVEKIIPGGHGLAFAEGLTLFVALAVPGDLLRVGIREVKGKIAFAEIEEVISSAASRIHPPCPYVGSCGGCDFQQMTYAAQLEAKVGILRDCLHRIGKLDHEDEIPIIPCPGEFGYRLRAQWHFDTAKRELGYFRRNSRDLIAVEHCMILAPELDKELQRLRADIQWSEVWSDKGSIDAALGRNSDLSTFSAELGLIPTKVDWTAAGEEFAFSADVFFQGNRFLIDTLVERAIGDAAGQHALDLYSGVGLFTLPLGRRFEKVTAVEEFSRAVAYARENVANAGLAQVKIVERHVGRFLAEQESGGIDFALLDPPRFGTEKRTVLELIRIRPRQVSYVSCDPSVLARDLRRFLDGGYRIDSIMAIDLFPQTHHVETVVRLIDAAESRA